MLQAFLQDYGYLALFIGTFFEGETILVLAGFLASRGYLDINLVMLTAASGGYCGDQLWYFLGRRKGRQVLARKPHWEALGDKALNHLRRYPDIWVLGFRFVYGLRTVMPVAIGISGYPPLRFLLLNAISAAIWAMVAKLSALPSNEKVPAAACSTSAKRRLFAARCSFGWTVGAAKSDSGPSCRPSANSSAASNPPEAGTTWRAPAMRCGMA